MRRVNTLNCVGAVFVPAINSPSAPHKISTDSGNDNLLSWMNDGRFYHLDETHPTNSPSDSYRFQFQQQFPSPKTFPQLPFSFGTHPSSSQTMNPYNLLPTDSASSHTDQSIMQTGTAADNRTYVASYGISAPQPPLRPDIPDELRSAFETLSQTSKNVSLTEAYETIQYDMGNPSILPEQSQTFPGRRSALRAERSDEAYKLDSSLNVFIQPKSAAAIFESFDTFENNGKKYYKCKKCSKVVTSRSNLYSHKNSHEERWKCQVCGLNCSSKCSLKDHTNSAHKGINVESVKQNSRSMAQFEDISITVTRWNSPKKNMSLSSSHSLTNMQANPVTLINS